MRRSGPSLIQTAAGAKARLPEPPRRLDAREAAILRGHADSMALRLACHNSEMHRRLTPQIAGARAAFDAVEQARVEAIGARRMEGVAANLDAMLDDRFQRARYADVATRADAPIEDALAMIVRERLTGQKPPASAQRIVDLWRSIDRGAGGRGSRPARRRDRGSARLRALRARLLTSLEMIDDRASTTGPRRMRARPTTSTRATPSGGGEGEEDQAGDAREMEKSEAAAEAMDDSETDAADAPTGEFEDEADFSDSEQAPIRTVPPTPGARAARRPTTRPSRRNSTKSSPRKIFATPRSWSGCAPISTSS